jgi:hypothetical protein
MDTIVTGSSHTSNRMQTPKIKMEFDVSLCSADAAKGDEGCVSVL